MRTMTNLGRGLTVAVVLFAVANVSVAVVFAVPWFAAAMLAFLLACQVGVTVAESYESESRSVSSLPDRPTVRVNADPATEQDAVRLREHLQRSLTRSSRPPRGADRS